jgi:hypothetical protein
VARVVVTAGAAVELRRMIRTHSLPANTMERVVRSLSVLEAFPEIGPALAGHWEGYRFVLGPRSWMVFVYEVIDDVVAIVTVQDARSSSAATGER